LDRDSVLDHLLPGSTFARFAARPYHCTFDAAEITVRGASLFLGNLAAFQLIEPRGARDDTGLLHTAAWLALPDFVRWLLDNGHDPNAKSDDFPEPEIPLAIVCRSKYNFWCRIGNQQANFITRREATMKLLARGTDTWWKYKGKTVLHFALGEGPLVASAMIEALNINRDRNRNEKYLYTEGNGVEYLPHMYVRYRMEVDNATKMSLFKCLKKANLNYRLLTRTTYAPGRQ
jgi:ankyrin repeat protein